MSRLTVSAHCTPHCLYLSGAQPTHPQLPKAVDTHIGSAERISGPAAQRHDGGQQRAHAGHLAQVHCRDSSAQHTLQHLCCNAGLAFSYTRYAIVCVAICQTDCTTGNTLETWPAQHNCSWCNSSAAVHADVCKFDTGCRSALTGMDSLMPMFVNRLIGFVCNCNPK